ncbi:bifunctional 23S rRNA (guanine(2069)-N(7))-methyltransferase RlmK/23S rRNA (guanine(2445)-N(2))-methyltransferase RlmL [Thioalkalivibrio sp. ALE17]|uniref:bifunctional 23S rRNA (guanine(2069)-N(7))-methyltransferase RlmK/23S rRNA (guanine(2445)-N(2))-methyltransferase RlmL n=1 Tax=Thioalkalivibrio sp. ALE17 TaxID=1158173 RepID=UPI00041FB31B|nr:bifunctional 23S rRNA (guanine(2069)-N(7))-methyltransferase RlmK/23S rRNA (guanine(2445)-N(2))-methyltransferase RlmL [Thioalkalivibrio sp. ALE17]
MTDTPADDTILPYDPAATTRVYLATAAGGLAPLVARELEGFGATNLREDRAGIHFRADLATLYRCLLGSRVASRILLPLARFDEPDGDACHAASRALDWPALFGLGATFAVDVTGKSSHIRHTHFAGVRVKDGIADAFRAATGERPDVDAADPDVRVLLQLQGRQAQLSLDIGNGGLHRRGYRGAGGQAPLRENLAAALLMRAGWPEHLEAHPDAPFLDPFCGSGTLVIEAALMATRTAPGLLRAGFRARGWSGHDAELWDRCLAEARDAVRPWDGPPLLGSDRDRGAVAAARKAARAAGVGDCTRFDQADALTLQPPADHGMLVSNPPYGERIGNTPELIKLYSLLGERLRSAFGGWHIALLVADTTDSQRLGLRASHKHRFYNGTLACHLLQFEIHRREEPPAIPAPDFANRLQKNLRHLTRWARRQGITCYRIYDSDLAEYPLQIDRYEAEDGTLHLHVQEFAAPASVEPARAEARLRGALAATLEVTGVEPAHLHYKQRRAQKGRSQYQRAEAAEAAPFTVVEHGCRLRVDLDAYLDSGLFLDHRPMRLRLQQECRDLRLLNLFCYTAAVSVHAAVGGARQTVSVDLSNTYLEWAEANFRANGLEAEIRDGRSRRLPGTHTLLREDVVRWLEGATDMPGMVFERIFLDPPTFSNSKRTEDDFEVQRDHVPLILAAARLLTPDGVLYFSTNRRRFELDHAALTGLVARDITRETLDEDFRRPPPPHRCWAITPANAG